VGGEKYQQAFYVFEELAQAPATSSTQSLISQAVSEIHLGRLEEAEAVLQQALAKDPENAEGIANSIVLNVIAGKDASELIRYNYLSLFTLLISANKPQFSLKHSTAACFPHRPRREERIIRQSGYEILCESCVIAFLS